MTVYRGQYAEITPGGAASGKLGRAASWTIDITGNFEPYFEVGKRFAVDGLQGNLEVTGTISHVWLNVDLINLLLEETEGLSSFSLMCYPSKPSAGDPYIYIKCAYPVSSSIDIPQDGWIMEDIDWVAISPDGTLKGMIETGVSGG